MGKEGDKKVHKKTQPVRYNHYSLLSSLFLDCIKKQHSLALREAREISTSSSLSSRSRVLTTNQQQVSISERELLTFIRPRVSRKTLNLEPCGEPSTRLTETVELSELSSLKTYHPEQWEQPSESCYTLIVTKNEEELNHG